MPGKSFFLVPFGKEKRPPFKVKGKVKRESGLLSVSFSLSGDLSQIVLPTQSRVPGRKDRLWEETCFEFFLSLKGSVKYWEFNLSPSKDWNVYRFSSYRRDMQDEKNFKILPFKVKRNGSAFSLSLSVDLDQIIQRGEPIELAVSTVIKTKEGQSYWALAHPGPKPDFHLREAFIFSL
jgi:hypothetical protein